MTHWVTQESYSTHSATSYTRKEPGREDIYIYAQVNQVAVDPKKKKKKKKTPATLSFNYMLQFKLGNESTKQASERLTLALRPRRHRRCHIPGTWAGGTQAGGNRRLEGLNAEELGACGRKCDRMMDLGCLLPSAWATSLRMQVEPPAEKASLHHPRIRVTSGLEQVCKVPWPVYVP